MVDAKSPYTAQALRRRGPHRRRPGRRCSASTSGTQRDLYRAGLLHDIGKLGVSNRILDKPERSTRTSGAAVRRHPLTSLQILRRVGALRNVARMAGLHHERLDGSGYYLGFDGTQLDLAARVLAVADVAEALAAERPYRDGARPRRGARDHGSPRPGPSSTPRRSRRSWRS